MATKNPEVKFRAWLGNDNGKTGGLWIGPGRKGDWEGWMSQRDNDWLTSLRPDVCALARQLLKHVGFGKRRRVEITVKFV